jgi:hypothetical protein
MGWFSYQNCSSAGGLRTRAVWEVRMNIWTEFKNTILPWLLAGGVVTL